MIAAVVLAGGMGSRIGGGKPLLDLGGSALVERAFAQAGDWCETVVVAVRSAEQLGDLALPTILDALEIEGPLGGLVSALRWGKEIGVEAVLTAPCDMPFLPDDLADRLIAAIGDNNAAIAQSDGKLHPVCGLWRVAALDSAQAFLDTGRRSLRGFAEQVGMVAVLWPDDPLDAFFNINDQAALNAARGMLGR